MCGARKQLAAYWYVRVPCSLLMSMQICKLQLLGGKEKGCPLWLEHQAIKDSEFNP
jgi:hypothetical protein